MFLCVCQPEPLKEPPNGTGIDKHAAVRAQAGRHFVQCDLAFGLDLFTHPAFMGRQLSDARITPAFGRKRPGFLLQFDHVIDKLDRNVKTRRRRTMGVARIDM